MKLSVSIRIRYQIKETSFDGDEVNVVRTKFIENSRKYEILNSKQIDETLPFILQDLSLEIKHKDYEQIRYKSNRYRYYTFSSC